MRIAVMLMFLFTAATCYADDPLETLNTVQDTVSTMEQALKARSAEHAPSTVASADGGHGADSCALADRKMYFISDQTFGENNWVRVRICSGPEAATSAKEDVAPCGGAEGKPAVSNRYIWKTRLALASDLQRGVTVIVPDKAGTGDWYLAKIADVSEIESGYVAVTAPVKAQLKSLRVVED